VTIAKTSESDPIRVDFLDHERYPILRRLGLTFAPGKKQGGARSGLWDRDLELDARRLRDIYRTDLLVSLLEGHELTELEIPDLVVVMNRVGIEVIRHPIQDGSVPEDIAAFVSVIERIKRALENRRTVVVHCKGGLGRAGTAAACAVVTISGGAISGQVAIQLVRDRRHGAIETLAQERFIDGFWTAANSG
jgi:hypothetical protein